MGSRNAELPLLNTSPVFTCLATLNILRALSRIDADHVGAWLCERQLPNGGLNGRPQKLEDVCYSWWVLSSLSMVQRLHWINARKLRRFILSAQVSCPALFPGREGSDRLLSSRTRSMAV